MTAAAQKEGLAKRCPQAVAPQAVVHMGLQLAQSNRHLRPSAVLVKLDPPLRVCPCALPQSQPQQGWPYGRSLRSPCCPRLAFWQWGPC